MKEDGHPWLLRAQECLAAFREKGSFDDWQAERNILYDNSPREMAIALDQWLWEEHEDWMVQSREAYLNSAAEGLEHEHRLMKDGVRFEDAPLLVQKRWTKKHGSHADMEWYRVAASLYRTHGPWGWTSPG